jgi:hypothetical protein
MLISEVDCAPLANAIAERLQFCLAMMGFRDIVIETDTLHVWAEIIVKVDNGVIGSWRIDTTELADRGTMAVISELALKIATRLGKAVWGSEAKAE